MTDDKDLLRRRQRLHSELDELLDWQDRLQARGLDEQENSGWAIILLRQAVEFARRASGKELIDAALRGVKDCDRASAINGIQRQITIAAELFDGALPSSSSATLSAAASELRAIWSGDEPKLFARMPGRKVPFRVAHAKLSAVGWDAYLAAKGEAAHVRHALIAAAFGHEWDTISRWRADVAKILGDKLVASVLREAQEMAKLGFKRPGSVAASGQEYKAAVGFNVV